MKQILKSNIEKELETVFSFFGSIVNACSSFAHKQWIWNTSEEHDTKKMKSMKS